MTADTYADASLFSLRGAVAKLASHVSKDDSQRDSQKSDFVRLLPSLSVTVNDHRESKKSPVNIGLKSLSDPVCHGAAKMGEWWALQDSNL